MNYSEKSNSWQPEDNIKMINRKRKSRPPNELPVKIVARFEKNWCLVKWKDGRTSTVQLSTKQTYEVIVNGADR